MTHCVDFWHKWRKEPNFCGLSPQSVSEIKGYLELVDKIKRTGIPEDTIYEKCPSGACRPLLRLADDETRTKALNYLVACLKRGEKITGGDLQSSIKAWLGNDTSCKTSAKSTQMRTDVNQAVENKPEKPSNEPKTLTERFGGDDKKPEPDKVVTPTDTPNPGLNEQEKEVLAESIDRHHDTLVKLSDEQQPRKAPCISGQPCPDGKDHIVYRDPKVRDLKAAKCALWNQYCLQLIHDECWLDAKARRDAQKAANGESLFNRASGLNIPPKSTQPLPTISKHPLLKTRKEQDAATETFIDNCLSDRYHRVIRDAMTDHKLGAPLDALCKALDLLSEWEGDGQ